MRGSAVCGLAASPLLESRTSLSLNLTSVRFVCDKLLILPHRSASLLSAFSATDPVSSARATLGLYLSRVAAGAHLSAHHLSSEHRYHALCESQSLPYRRSFSTSTGTCGELPHSTVKERCTACPALPLPSVLPCSAYTTTVSCRLQNLSPNCRHHHVTAKTELYPGNGNTAATGLQMPGDLWLSTDSSIPKLNFEPGSSTELANERLLS